MTDKAKQFVEEFLGECSGTKRRRSRWSKKSEGELLEVEVSHES